MRFRAYNFDPAVKAQAQRYADERTKRLGFKHVVEYLDSYSDLVVMGDYIVRSVNPSYAFERRNQGS